VKRKIITPTIFIVGEAIVLALLNVLAIVMHVYQGGQLFLGPIPPAVVFVFVWLVTLNTTMFLNLAPKKLDTFSWGHLAVYNAIAVSLAIIVTVSVDVPWLLPFVAFVTFMGALLYSRKQAARKDNHSDNLAQDITNRLQSDVAEGNNPLPEEEKLKQVRRR
jgi:hypothetical protein